MESENQVLVAQNSLGSCLSLTLVNLVITMLQESLDRKQCLFMHVIRFQRKARVTYFGLCHEPYFKHGKKSRLKSRFQISMILDNYYSNNINNVVRKLIFKKKIMNRLMFYGNVLLIKTKKCDKTLPPNPLLKEYFEH